jgi:hypothetical protein
MNIQDKARAEDVLGISAECIIVGGIALKLGSCQLLYPNLYPRIIRGLTPFTGGK